MSWSSDDVVGRGLEVPHHPVQDSRVEAEVAWMLDQAAPLALREGLCAEEVPRGAEPLLQLFGVACELEERRLLGEIDRQVRFE